MNFFKKAAQGPAIHNRPQAKEILTDALFILAGCAVFSVSVSVFTAPNKIAPGGVTGIATMLQYLFHTPIGVMIFVLNIPLLALAMRYIGGRFIVKTIICTALVSVGVDLMALLPKYSGNLLLAALYGGVLSGAGLGLVFLRGATTGGTDVASRLVKLKYGHIPMGRMMMIIDACVVSVSAVVFQSVDSALYAMVTIFTSSRVIDFILYGSDNCKMALVISEKKEEIAKIITTNLSRGVTVIHGTGYYTGRERNVLLCVVRPPEASKLRSIVKSIDQQAFVILCDAGEVLGEGFKSINKEVM
jgi:uncharacterized membrane-anchored protein YitT (DUF2179 family)